VFMMSLQPTPYDLNWRMFGIPVRVHPSFWLIALLFSWDAMQIGVQFLLLGIACMLASLLAHEMAHALMFRFFRVDSSIICYSFGGLTIPEGRLRNGVQSIMVTLAGPLTNLAIAGALWCSDRIEPWATTRLTVFLFLTLFYINLGWGIMNLLPVWPLDGGQVSRTVWLMIDRRQGVIASLTLSVVAAGAIAAFSFACSFNVIRPDWDFLGLRPTLYVGILFAILAVQSYMELQNQRAPREFDRWDN
jgi:stage IV sporulation protein FB